MTPGWMVCRRDSYWAIPAPPLDLDESFQEPRLAPFARHGIVRDNRFELCPGVKSEIAYLSHQRSPLSDPARFPFLVGAPSGKCEKRLITTGLEIGLSWVFFLA